MTTPPDPSRPAAPSVREIAALTARLRALTSGQDVDSAERAAFLADKQALLARIDDQHTDQHTEEHRPSEVGRSSDEDADSHISAVSWAVAARDAAIDRGDPSWASRFAREAGEAIADAERFGLTREQLAAELDYPGGADELEMSSRDAAADAESRLDPLPGFDPDGGVFVPHRTADPDRAQYETMNPQVAVERVTAAGFTAEDAEFMVDEYLTEQTTRHGAPDGGWAVDPHDLTQITQRYEWVDRGVGETIDAARDRAREYAVGWFDRVSELKTTGLPGFDRAVREAKVWTARAQGETVEQHDAQNVVERALDEVDNAREAGAPPEVMEQHVATARQAIEDAAAVGVTREPWLAELAHTLNPPTWWDEHDHHGWYHPKWQEVDRAERDTDAEHLDETAAAGRGPVDRDDQSGVGMPEWMGEQARRTEAEVAAGTYEPGPPDDMERMTDRLAEIRAAAERDVHEAGDADGTGSPSSADAAWWAPTGPDEMALTQREAAEELTERGFTPDQARAAISEYLDDTSDRIGISAHQWLMDTHDIEAITHTHRPSVPVPEQRHPSTAEQTSTADPTPTRRDAPPDHAGEREDREQLRGGDAASVPTTHRPDRSTDVEGERREQLVRWHTDDTTGGPDLGADGDGIGSDSASDWGSDWGSDWDDEPMIFEGRW